MWRIILFLSVTCLTTLTNGQQQSDLPRIVDFMTRDLLAPGDVKFRKKNALKLPCNAVGNNLQWTWKHNDSVISTSEKFTINAKNGTLHGSYLESAHSGHYQCFVKDLVSGIETFSRKIMVAVTVVGKFNDQNTSEVLVDLGQEFSYYCPQHSPSFGISYSWQEKVSGRNILQFKRNDRRAITQTGQLLIMYVTQQDLDDFVEYESQGIRCFMTGANVLESSGLLKLKKRNSDQKDPQTLSAPKWKITPKATEMAAEGRNKTLYCLAFGRPAPNITWKISRGGKWEQIVNEKDNFKIPGAFHGRLLEISFVNQSTHQTQYRCEASNSQSSGNPLVHEVDLKVEAPPRWMAAPPQNISIDVNGNGSLTCDVFADPLPSFKWYKDGKQLATSTAYVRLNDNKLYFTNVRYPDEIGLYQCVSENPHGMIVSYTRVRILVKAPSFSEIERGFGPFYLFNGTEGRLTCNPEAVPRPSEYKWYNGTTLLTSSPRYRIEHGEFSTLIINKVEKEDEGPYTCYAENFLGNATETANATVLERTIITVRPENKTVQEGTRVNLSCKAEADPSLDLSYYWKKNNSDIEYNNRIQWLEEDKVLTIANITVDDAGNYTCVAYTPDPKRSEDQASAVINIVPGPPRPPGPSPIYKTPTPTPMYETPTPIYETVWLITLLIVIAFLFIVLLIFQLYTRHGAAKYPVEKREKKRAAFIEKEPLDEEKGAVTSAGRPEIPPPYQSKGSRQRSPQSDRDSLDEYGPKFQKNGSFTGTYGNKTKNAPEKTDDAVFDTYV